MYKIDNSKLLLKQIGNNLNKLERIHVTKSIGNYFSKYLPFAINVIVYLWDDVS